MEDSKNSVAAENDKTAGKEQIEGNVPSCPMCGSPMVIRTAKRGNNAGNQFYGCSKNPQCKEIRSV